MFNPVTADIYYWINDDRVAILQGDYLNINISLGICGLVPMLIEQVLNKTIGI